VCVCVCARVCVSHEVSSWCPLAGEGAVKGLCACMQAHADVQQCVCLHHKGGARPFPYSLPPPRACTGLIFFLTPRLGSTRPPCCLPLCPSPLPFVLNLCLCLPLCLSPSHSLDAGKGADKVPPTRHQYKHKASVQNFCCGIPHRSLQCQKEIKSGARAIFNSPFLLQGAHLRKAAAAW